MIAYLKGQFAWKSPAMVYVDVQGVGYEVNITLNTYSKISGLDSAILYTYLQIKEDGHTLYGFADPEEKGIFMKLIGVNGVGASTARMMLSSLQPAEVSRAIQQADTRLLESIKGIGKKTAERIVLELRDKMGKADPQISGSAAPHNTLAQDALQALVALGIPRQTAEQAIHKIQKEGSAENLEQLIKKALQSI